MCILQGCANSTTEGVWWRDDTEWCRYSERLQALIRQSIADNCNEIDLGTIMSAVHPNGAQYVLDLLEMEQTSVLTGMKRPVMVVDPASTQVVQRRQQFQPGTVQLMLRNVFVLVAEKTTLPGTPSRSVLPLALHYKDSDGNLQQYDRDIETLLLQYMASGSQRTLLVPDGRLGHYFFDLGTMEQRFVSRIVNGEPILSDEPPLQIIAEVLWDAAAKMMAAVVAEAEKSLRRKVLVLVVDRFKCSENLGILLSEKAYPRAIVKTRISTYSTTLYDKFVDSLDEVMQRLPKDRMGEIIRNAGKEDCKDMPLQVAFKPAKRSDASKTSVKSKAFWISMAAPVATAHAVVYGAVHLEILAFLLIVPDSVSKMRAQTTSDSCSGYVEVERPEYRLPLAQVSVR